MTALPALLRARSNAQLAGASVVLSFGWLVWQVVADGAPVGVSVAFVVVGGVVVPVFAVVVGVRLVGRPIGLSHRLRRALQVTSATAIVALALTSNSFFVGFDEADTGRANGLYASLTTTFALVSFTGFAAAIAIVFFALLRRRLARAASIAVSVPLGAIAAPLAAFTLFTSGGVVAFSLVVFVYSVLPTLSRAITLPVLDRPVVADEGVRSRVAAFARLSLAITVAVWVGGIAVSILNAGTDVATLGLGLASAAAQLAVIPLLWALTLVLDVWLPRTSATTRLGFAVASAIVTGSAIAMIVGYSPDGNRFVLLAGVLGLGIGVWTASVMYTLCAALPVVARVVVSMVALLVCAAVYAWLAALSGGIALAFLSGFLAFGGARRVLRRRLSTGR